MKLAVWYHCVLSGPRIPSEDFAVSILSEQMHALKESGLFDAAQQRCFCVNGGDVDFLTLASFVPAPGNVVANHEGQSEIPTMNLLRQNLKPGWAVMYHHIKGVQHPGNPQVERWRRCMEHVCVWNWNGCVAELERRSDTCGAHWLTHEKYPMLGVGQRYWGGNFWWATSDYLLTLPPLPNDSFENRYEAESWIGKSPRNPRIYDFAPHWPTKCL
jgi:hypothetical protein